MPRPSYKITTSAPGSEIGGEYAAALAAISLVLEDEDPVHAAELREHAEALYNFADTYKGVYSDSIEDAQSFYRSWSGYNDELVWAAIWLHRATGKESWLTTARNKFSSISGRYNWGLSWDDKSYACYILLAMLDGSPQYKSNAENWLNFWTIGHNSQQITYTPGGLAWLTQWGSLRYAANTAFCAQVYADHVNDPEMRYSNFAKAQADYMLGSNPDDRSYLCGFGNNPPVNPHHRNAHHSTTNNINSPTLNTHTLYGALVGGPDAVMITQIPARTISPMK